MLIAAELGQLEPGIVIAPALGELTVEEERQREIPARMREVGGDREGVVRLDGQNVAVDGLCRSLVGTRAALVQSDRLLQAALGRGRGDCPGGARAVAMLVALAAPAGTRIVAACCRSPGCVPRCDR